MSVRSILRRVLYTSNTIRYRVEWPRLREAFQQIGKVGTLFDGGCGSGEFARRVLDEGLCEKVIGLEYDDNNYRELQANLGWRPEVQTMQASLLEIPLADASVDMVMSTQVIEHIADHEGVARELVRILKPGGHALITVPHPPEPFPNDDHVRKGYTDADLLALFEPLGLKPLRTDYFLTRNTTDRMKQAWKLPARGVFLPVAWVDQETTCSLDERKSCDPFGILMLFQKKA
ncbi:methyltransferase family protein [Roseimicrobium gellanilyticum]|uniref:Methyltransferase family protein n=1 Tax=Roseimicrobium gellanilyticum TaxID=748857 RepID=A0A366H628_9BACT|nr:class I SAM-dependent methyltransferase [Roseimicrobium gellanilyticum]RBP36364.1 methyltransferase family protein [Roseimicrobium gellanilyticum]